DAGDTARMGTKEPTPRDLFGSLPRETVDVRSTPLETPARHHDLLGRMSGFAPRAPRLVTDAETRTHLDLREQVRAVALARRLLRLEIGRLERMRSHAATRLPVRGK